jgi:hypothetical protein
MYDNVTVKSKDDLITNNSVYDIVTIKNGHYILTF